MKEEKSTLNGFTLIEMLVVLAIIVLLASLILPAVNGALQRGRQTKCMSQLRQFGVAWNSRYMEVSSSRYGDQMDAVYPWLSAMVPTPLGDPRLLICPSDTSGGEDGSKPDSPQYEAMAGDPNQFTETDDLDNNPQVDACSYFYEFCDAEFNDPWWQNYVYGNSSGDFLTSTKADIDDDGRITWGEVKLHQLEYGDASSGGEGYDRTKFPLVRCFHHYDDKKVLIRNLDDNTNDVSVRVLNLAVAGNAFVSGLKWEYPIVQ